MPTVVRGDIRNKVLDVAATQPHIVHIRDDERGSALSGHSEASDPNVKLPSSGWVATEQGFIAVKLVFSGAVYLAHWDCRRQRSAQLYIQLFQPKSRGRGGQMSNSRAGALIVSYDPLQGGDAAVISSTLADLAGERSSPAWHLGG
ncbi:hypothetical protein CCHR01_19741 [Colletotrichum chrysophilum]|uniref:Uncharacterized protein n=1 Tax=Colletotrichum chrysophilum TaxID=1836956 RepID=A0AAD8ZYG0_9PEZI|nr:hypothetical protein CCHR01_19741 [Colletotrichum chrysophilum]